MTPPGTADRGFQLFKMCSDLCDCVLLVIMNFWEPNPHPFICSTNGGSPIDFPFGVKDPKGIVPHLKEITSGLGIRTSERFWFEKRVESNVARRCPASTSHGEQVNYNKYICQVLTCLGNRLNSRVDDIYRVRFSIRSTDALHDQITARRK